MTDLSWHEFLKIGVEFIDNDHKKLLHIMQDTKKAIEDDDQKKCVRLLTSLLKEAREHFSREEKFLSEAKYPGLDEHIIYHQTLLLKAHTTKKICEGIQSDHDLEKCFDGMAQFLIDDILKGDIMFKSFLQYEGYIENE